jgi:hypothetical protein
MNERIALLQQRRKMLQLRAEAQRAEVESLLGRARSAFAVVDMVAAGFRLAREHPFMTALALVAVVRLARHPLGRWAGRAAAAFRLVRAFGR